MPAMLNIQLIKSVEDRIMVARGGIEPPTRGFSGPVNSITYLLC
jgi:hypothetical protein